MDLINHVMKFLLAQLSLKPRIVHHYETHTVMQNNVEENSNVAELILGSKVRDLWLLHIYCGFYSSPKN